MKTIFTCGTFDMCHEGHLRLLREMKERGIVIVFLYDDASSFKVKGHRTFYDYKTREQMLMNTGLPNAIIKVETEDPTENFIEFKNGIEIHNFLYICGDDKFGSLGLEYLRNVGIKIKYINSK